MSSDIACQSILAQLRSSWDMLRQAIDKVPLKYWYRSYNDWTFSATVYHIIATQEFYFRDTPEGMRWGRLYGDLTFKADVPEKYYPSKEILLEYQERLETEISECLESIDDGDLGKSDGFVKYFPNVHVKLLYLLRHNAHHIGELAHTLREWNVQRINWI